MNGYPKVFNIEADPREQFNIGAQYEWVIGPVLKPVKAYLESVTKYPNPTGGKYHGFLFASVIMA